MSEQINSALKWACSEINPCSETARLDAELLLAHCLNKPRSYVYSWPEEALNKACWQRFQALVKKRVEPTPVAYLLGSREFYSMEFATSPVALIPRPETELLVDLALQLCPTDKAINILEMGTGTGVIAITLKKQRPLAVVRATDIDPACIALARENAVHHQVDVEFIESDWYTNIPDSPLFDLIVSNPPYIAANHPFLAIGDLPAEPSLALSPGETGLEALQQIIGKASNYLLAGGHLIFEHGYDQQSAVSNLLENREFDEIRCHLDANNLPRVSLGSRP